MTTETGAATIPDVIQAKVFQEENAGNEATRVLTELREERRDEREWVAFSAPGPFEVAAGIHPGGLRTLTYSDLRRGGQAA